MAESSLPKIPRNSVTGSEVRACEEGRLGRALSGKWRGQGLETGLLQSKQGLPYIHKLHALEGSRWLGEG